MLVGKSYNKLDEQRRLTIPKNMRPELGKQAVLTRGLDGGLFLFPDNYWKKIVNNLVEQPFTKRKARDFWRYLSNDAYSVVPDKIGRITIPSALAEFAGINNEAVVIGSLQYAEIWDQQRYNHYFDELAQHAEEIAEDIPWTNIESAAGATSNDDSQSKPYSSLKSSSDSSSNPSSDVKNYQIEGENAHSSDEK